MACFHPLDAFQLSSGDIVFTAKKGMDVVRPLSLACGQCIGCRLERSRKWAVRCMHEASLHDCNSFVTLTYEDDSVLSLDYSHFQSFIKRLRARASRVRIRYFVCGEYGEDFGRPHFHALLFGYRPDDLVLFSKKSNTYTSEVLSDAWSRGFVLVGNVTFASAAYVARYVLKKVTGPAADDHYVTWDGDGVVVNRVPEFVRMSLRPGIGAEWFRRFRSDVYPCGEVVVNGKKCGAPRYYDELLKKEDFDCWESMTWLKYDRAGECWKDKFKSRLLVREQVAMARAKAFRRSL